MEKILDKLKKLIALQEGAEKIGSISEAANAAEKIQTILIKYNLEMSQVLNHKRPEKLNVLGIKIMVDDLGYDKRHGKWLSYLMGGIARYNFGKVINNLKNGEISSFHFLAAEQNLFIIEYLAQYLSKTAMSLERQEYKNFPNEPRGSFRRRFLMGAAMGIISKLREQLEYQEQHTEGVTALVVFNREAIELRSQELYPALRSGKGAGTGTMRTMVGDIAAIGYTKGQEVQINRGVEGNSNLKELK